jgi:type II secretory pathway pseudopilin PulG
MRSFRQCSTWRSAGVVLLALASWTIMSLSAEARRGPSKQQIQALQQQQQQQQQMAVNLEKAKQKKDDEVMKRFDLNKNGKIDSNEKAPFDKYWRDVRLGKEPHPYASITDADIKPTPASTSKTKAKPAANKN